MDIPVLKYSAPGCVGKDRTGVGMPSGYPPSMHFLLRARHSHSLPENVVAVARMHRHVAIAMKNNGRDSRPFGQI